MVNPILLIIVPIAAAFFIPIISKAAKSLAKYIAFFVGLFNLIAAIYIFMHTINTPISVIIAGYKPPVGINLYVGPLAAVLSIVITFIGFLSMIYSFKYINDDSSPLFYSMFLLLLTGAIGMVLTADIFNLFVFFEILCISSYALVAYDRNRDGLEASMKYLIQGSIGSVLILFGIALIYFSIGTLNMADIALKYQNANKNLITIAIILMITGFGIEAAIFPLNSWLPDAHSSAPSSISAVLSGFVIEVALIIIMKIIFLIFSATYFLTFFAIVGVITLLMGELSAFKQENIKRVLAYSSIGQIGLILFAFSINTPQGISGGIFQIINHAVSKSLLFLSAGYVIHKTGSKNVSDYKGIAKSMPFLGIVFIIGALSLIGIPPFIGFFSKFNIILAAISKHSVLYIVLTALVLLGTIFEASYFFKIAKIMYTGKKRKEGYAKVPFAVLFPLGLLAIIIVISFIYTNGILNYTNKAGADLINKIAFIHAVLG
ncbi:MAG: NADH-quinone oxidoreductase subunit F [Spirochaetes bacterium]|nr:MAG: NADH-quinone oxidoreductase subunit F [Spirochaetota bacterium]